jgi:hypothetical protein
LGQTGQLEWEHQTDVAGNDTDPLAEAEIVIVGRFIG